MPHDSWITLWLFSLSLNSCCKTFPPSKSFRTFCKDFQYCYRHMPHPSWFNLLFFPLSQGTSDTYQGLHGTSVAACRSCPCCCKWSRLRCFCCPWPFCKFTNFFRSILEIKWSVRSKKRHYPNCNKLRQSQCCLFRISSRWFKAPAYKISLNTKTFPEFCTSGPFCWAPLHIRRFPFWKIYLWFGRIA